MTTTEEMVKGLMEMTQHQHWTWQGSRLIDDQAVRYLVDIDATRVGRMAVKAFHNKSQRTKLGPVTVKIVKNK